MEYREVIESIDEQNEWSYDIFITVKHEVAFYFSRAFPRFLMVFMIRVSTN